MTNEIKTANLQTTAKNQIVKLEKYLEQIYTVEVDTEFASSGKKEINLAEEKAIVRDLIYVYENGLQANEGSIYEEYSKYLSNAREYLDKLMDIETDINSKHGSDIKNLNALIFHFNRILDNN
ncbi:hypothetical protein [Lysinibacillus sp. fls2-241-R2A-57]|uniref:hypothetical protein n=1 Tax=Lysinibacillus sp. fls2-241-R2A-57 TaxID=3040292 RepID=UPI00255319DD|nr:hypothetical protein [Lysinibacillus sp. fls2-241-R2A-57]